MVSFLRVCRQSGQHQPRPFFCPAVHASGVVLQDWQGNTGWSQYLCEQFLSSGIGLLLVRAVRAAAISAVSGDGLARDDGDAAVGAVSPFVSGGFDLRDRHAGTFPRDFGGAIQCSTNSRPSGVSAYSAASAHEARSLFGL